MPEVKCKKPSEEISSLIEPCFEKGFYTPYRFEGFQRWTSVGQTEPSSVIKPSLRDTELDKKVEAFTKKVEALLKILKNRPLVRNAILRDLNSSKYSLKENIEISIEEYPDETIAQWPEIEVFGHGVKHPEAVLDLKNEIIDLYEDLSSTKKKELGKLPEMWLRILKKIIKKND